MPFIKAKAFLYDTGINVPLIVSWPGKTKNGSIHNNGLISGVDIAPTILDLAGIGTPAAMYGRSFKPLILDPSQRGRDVIYSERNWHDTEEYSRCIRTGKYKLIYDAYPNTLTAITGDMRNSPAWFELLDAKNSNRLNSQQSQVFIFPRPGIELYDLEKDPYENSNLAEKQEYYETAVTLYKQLRAWQKETHDTQPEDRVKKD
jgi:arylsulfatase A-like enzyme